MLIDKLFRGISRDMVRMDEAMDYREGYISKKG